MRGLRYRTGLDARTGQPLRGWPHVVQSLETIWSTRLDSRVMRLGFGSELFSRLGEDITPALALQLYTDLTVAAHAWEPEYRITSMQLVNLTSAGALGLRHSGIYYPEGRFGIFDFEEAVTAAVPLMALRSGEGANT
jgi:hypothetical protein